MRPGFSCSADILTGTAAGVLAVPIQALVVREKEAEGEAKPKEEEGVYILKSDGKKKTAAFAAVTAGMTGETQVEIQSGLAEGDEIITGPFKSLREIKDGDRVRLEEPKKKDGKSDKKAD